MANSDRDIVISPDRGTSSQPTIYFTGADSLSSATIVLRVYNSGTDATLSFEGDVGQLFSITDSVHGPIFSVNDVTGIPSIEVLDTGEIKMAQYNGYVNILGTTNATSTATGVLRVAGGVGIGKDTYIGGNLTVGGNLTAGSGTVFGTISTATTVAITDDASNASVHYPTFVSATSGNRPLRVDSSALVYKPSTNSLGLGTTDPYSRLSIVSSANTEGISLFTSGYEASRQWGTRIWKNDVGGGIPLQIETQYTTTWYNSVRIDHGQDSNHPSLTTFYETLLASSGGNVGVGITPTNKFHVSGTAKLGFTYTGFRFYESGDNSRIDFVKAGNDTASARIEFDGYSSASTHLIDSITFSLNDSGSTMTSRFQIMPDGRIGLNTTDYSYASSDNTPLVGSNTSNKVFVNGSIQLLSNNDAIVIGRGTASFFKDEELGFGWGGGWYMTDATYLRSRNYKHVYNENTFSGGRFQGYSTDYNQPNMFMPRWDDTYFAFGMSSNNSNTYWMQAKYYGTSDNTRGFRVLDSNTGVARMSVADKITTHQNTFYRTFQNYTGSDNGPVKTWDGVLIAGSDYSGANAYTIIDTGVPQDSYMMGGFTIEWFENYYSTNGKTSIKLGGYWNPQSNGGFLGWEYTSSNPNIAPTIQVGRNSSTGNTAIILTHFNSNYAIIVARDLWLGYSGGDYNYGHGWAIRQQADLTGYTNLVSVVARRAQPYGSGAGSGLDADTLDGYDSVRFLRSVGHPGYGDWNTFGNNNPQTVMQMFQENFNIGSNTGSSNYPSPSYPYGTLVNFDANSSARAQMYISHAGPDLHFRGGWGTGSWQTWYKTWNTGNDGAGSGLDADLLDGLDSTIVMRPVTSYKWDVTSNGSTGRRHTILRLYGTPNHWGAWQNIEITLHNTYFNGGFVKYYLYGYYGMGNGNSWILHVKDAGGVGTGYMRVSLGTVTYAGFTSGGQNTYYQDVYVDVDYYTSVKVIAEFYGTGYQTTAPGAEIYHTTQLFTSPATASITYSNDDKSSSYLFTNKIWNAGNDGAGSGLDADLLDGLELHTGRNNEVNKVVRTDANGYIQAGWINTTSGDLDRALPDRVYLSNDGYIRYATRNMAKAHLGNTYKYSDSRPNITSDSNYWVGSMGWSTTDLNSILDWGSGFWDSWSNPGNQPSGTSHWVGMQAEHYTNGTNRYGWQMTMGAGDPSLTYIRGVWGGSPSSWYKVNLLGLNQGSISNYASIYYDSDDAAFYVDPNATSVIRYLKVNTAGSSSGTRALTIKADGQGEINFGSYPGAWTSALQIQNNNNTDFVWISPIDDGYNARIRASGSGLDFYTDGGNDTGTYSAFIGSGSVRAPIFYDLDDVNYYGDFASTSRLNQLRLVNTTAHYYSGTSEIQFIRDSSSGSVTYDFREQGTTSDSDSYGVMYLSRLNHNNGHNSGANLYFRSKGSNGALYEWAGIGGLQTSAGSYAGRLNFWVYSRNNVMYLTSAGLYAPIYYDSNNSSYYVDPAGNSVLNTLTVNNISGTSSIATYARRLDGHTRSSFTVGGSASTYYPVVFNIGTGATAQQYGEFMIERGGYDDPGYTGIGFTNANIRFTVKASGWGFGSTYENVEGYYVTTNVMANWEQVSQSSRLVVWLRGATIYYWYNIVGYTSLYFGNPSGTSWTDDYSASYTYTASPTTTVQPRAQHGRYFNTGAMLDGSTRIQSLGVGTNASGTTGEIRATSEITAYYSDRRLKENIEVIENAVEKVKKLTGVTYNANDVAASYGYDPEKKQVGLLADEVEAVLPEVIRPAPFDADSDGGSKSGQFYKTVQYEKVVPLLVEAIKEQQRSIENQEQRLSEVESRINNSTI